MLRSIQSHVLEQRTNILFLPAKKKSESDFELRRNRRFSEPHEPHTRREEIFRNTTGNTAYFFIFNLHEE